MRRPMVLAGVVALVASVVCAQDESGSPGEQKKSYPGVPEEYEVGEETVSPDGRFAILYPVRDEDSTGPVLENILVRLKPYAVVKKIEGDPCWKDMRGAPRAMWNDNSIVAIWRAMKWGDVDLVVYEIENDRVKRVQKIWPEVEKYFDRDFRERFLKKYPREYRSYTFRADGIDQKDFEFKDRKLLLDIFAENKPNLAPGPIWSAELRATWDLDKAKFEKVDFRPGEISIRKQEE